MRHHTTKTSPRRPAPRERFLTAFEAALGQPAVRLGPRRIVAWRTGTYLDHVRVYRWPGEPSAAPITRIAVNHYGFVASPRTLARLGFEGDDRPRRREKLHPELTVLDSELESFAAWLPRWIAARMDESVPLPEPPHACHVWHRPWETADYAWSTAAWEVDRAWREKQEAARNRRRRLVRANP